MATKTQGRESAIFHMASAIAFLAITMPLGLIYDLHQAGEEASTSFTSFRFAWPIYFSAACGAVWAFYAAATWTVMFEDPRREPDWT